MRLELQQLRRNPMVMLSGRAPLLEILDAYLVATDARLESLEAFRTSQLKQLGE